jgi:hypothetical protein
MALRRWGPLLSLHVRSVLHASECAPQKYRCIHGSATAWPVLRYVLSVATSSHQMVSVFFFFFLSPPLRYDMSCC